MASLADVLSRLDRAHVGLRSALDTVPSALRNQAPVEGRWSAAGVVEHLALVEERYSAILSRGIAAENAGASGEDAARVAELPATIEAMLADRTARRTAPDPLLPTGLDWAAALERADAARRVTRQLMCDADALAWNRIIHEHPRFGALNVFQWGGFLAAHELRHAEQLREIAAQVVVSPQR